METYAQTQSPTQVLDLLQSDRARQIYRAHEVELAYLFGSQARGTTGPLSDVDVAVQFRPGSDKLERFRHRLELIGKLGTLLSRNDVEVVDLGEAPPLLRHRVYYHGEVIYCSDDAVRVRFETTALRDYVDTEPLRRLRYRYMKASLRRGAN